jgi:hypothetical protein
VYTAGHTGVIYNYRTNEQRHLRGHVRGAEAWGGCVGRVVARRIGGDCGWTGWDGVLRVVFVGGRVEMFGVEASLEGWSREFWKN